MKTTTSLALGMLASPLVQAHYIFSQMIHNGQAVGGDYTYIRKNSNSYMPSFTNDVVNSPNLRCNSGATAGSAKTLEVAAGDKVGFKLWFNENIEHPGPGFVYMSRAPNDNVNAYDGSGDWFKAFETGLCNGTPNQDTAWCTWQKDRIEYTIPKDIPSGEYLVRVEHIAIHESHVGKAQFYMECAQLKITGGGNGTPGPLAKIPGIYTASDAGIAYNKWTSNPAPYTMPGPKVWTAGSSSSGGGGASSSAPVTEETDDAPSAVPEQTTPSNPPTGSAPAPGGGAAGGAALWAQCGGNGHTGASTCAQGTCKHINPYYSQCVN